VQKEKGEGGLYTQHGLRETEGEFGTLYKELIDNKVKFYGYFRMNRECFFCFTRESETITYTKMNEISKACIT
jgi:hypothetical protein